MYGHASRVDKETVNDEAGVALETMLPEVRPVARWQDQQGRAIDAGGSVCIVAAMNNISSQGWQSHNGTQLIEHPEGLLFVDGEQ